MRLRCGACEVEIEDSQRLTAPNPFDGTDVLFGCPTCKSVDTWTRMCDVEGCRRIVSCGYPDGDRYWMVCLDHYKGQA